ncbi:MAG: hypothetical protein M3R22_11025 [Pseudomonadota bacterium]|nr:hypothetical protein [Pseudomonadota bacterium]
MADRRFVANLMTFTSLALAATTASAQRASSPPANRPTTAGSLSGSQQPTTSECAALRKLYLDSQACFEPYRMAHGGLRREAFKHCKNVVDPSPRCGDQPDLPTK